MKVKKGVIAAAGRGTRFLPFTKGCPKELIPVLNKPNIQYLVEELIGAGIDQIAIVHSPGNYGIKHYFTPDPGLEKFLKTNKKQEHLDSLRQIWKKIKVLKFIPQSPRLPYGNATPVLAAELFIGKEPFVYMFGDDLVIEDEPGKYLSRLIKIYEKYKVGVVLAVQKVPWSEINRYASIEYVEDPKYPNRAIKVLEKLPADQAPSNVAQFGRFVFSPKLFEILDRQKIRKGELWLADTNNKLAQVDVAIAEPIKDGFWLTTGDPLRWLETNIVVALRNEKIKKGLKEFIKELDVLVENKNS